ncbi:MAG: DUF6883 domain-containing protein [Cyanobacteria bacterium P01_C01_bin.118]
MKLQGPIIIPDAKLTQYLLISKARNDKSKFLAQAGFTLENPEELKQALFQLIQTHEAKLDYENEYGSFYLVEGNLIGPNGTLIVVTVWLERTVDGVIQFITLKPSKR